LFWGGGFDITSYFKLPCPSHCSRSCYSVDANGNKKTKTKNKKHIVVVVVVVTMPRSSQHEDCLETQLWSQNPHWMYWNAKNMIPITKLWQWRWQFNHGSKERTCWKCQSCVRRNNTADGSKMKCGKKDDEYLNWRRWIWKKIHLSND
jgi:hypothetical protein